MEEKKGPGRGGCRPGAGRPKGDSRLYTFRAGGGLARALDSRKDRASFIRRSIEAAIEEEREPDSRKDRASFIRRSIEAAIEEEKEPDFSVFGDVVPASGAGPVVLPSFEVRVAAGFPVPLDNDEKNRDIDMLRLLCPHPESSYLIRVQGESMIDAGVQSGDIVIVDKSRRDPSEKEIAVCELNGEYTVKRVAVEKDGSRWLVPANPDYPRLPVTEGDDFSVWGVVTYIIHRARD